MSATLFGILLSILLLLPFYLFFLFLFTAPIWIPAYYLYYFICLVIRKIKHGTPLSWPLNQRNK